MEKVPPFNLFNAHSRSIYFGEKQYKGVKNFNYWDGRGKEAVHDTKIFLKLETSGGLTPPEFLI